LVIETLLDLLSRFEGLGKREALRHRGRFRTRVYSYADLWRMIGGFRRRLEEEGLGPGDRILLWGENSPEWIAAFWGAVAQGVQLVPLDPQMSSDFALRVQSEARCRLLVHGSSQAIQGFDVPHLAFDRIGKLPGAPLSTARGASPSDIVEIVYTSGTTGRPKGVVHRHGNLCSNLRPFDREFRRYRALARPFQPVRILNLLPLSHMFGQAMTLFIPVLLGGAVVLTESVNSPFLLTTIREERVSVLVTVPRMLGQFGEFLQRRLRFSEKTIRFRGIVGAAERWWKYRHIHRELGFKFWAVVVGGATLEAEIERFWSGIGILVLQGYGLTEAGPVVAVNHPFKARRGALGRVLEGQEVRLAPDGEILIRGDSVTWEYYSAAGDSPTRKGGWFPTGDLGAFDEEGNLYFRGRKKDLIVTAEGLNVVPDDVEDVLKSFDGVKDAAVIPWPPDRENEVHAVLIPAEPELDMDELIRTANSRLEPHQRIRGWSAWPEKDFPRTAGTLKLSRRRVLSILAGREAGSSERVEPDVGGVDTMLARLARRSAGEIRDQDRLDEDLGLSSLDRLELLSRLEEEAGTDLDETDFTALRTVAEMRSWAEGFAEGPSDRSRETAPLPMPRWTRTWPARTVRRIVQDYVMATLFRRYIRMTVHGAERLADVGAGPVLFTANHTSLLDVIALLVALPRAWRRRLAPAMVMERFEAHFRPGEHSWRRILAARFQYLLACLLFNVYPLPQRSAAFRHTIRYTGELVGRGYSPLVFPEGRRTRDGRLLPFKPGATLLAAELRLPVVPVYIEGLLDIMPPESRWPRTGRASLSFGAVFRVDAQESPESATARLERHFRDQFGKE
jgi:long-chain acyl-CoA synthetase